MTNDDDFELCLTRSNGNDDDGDVDLSSNFANDMFEIKLTNKSGCSTVVSICWMI